MTDTLLTGASSIQPEDLVVVRYPMGERTNNPAHKFDGEQFVVKNKRMVDHNSKGGDRYVYELHGANSDEGVPYAFLTDELIKL